MLWLGQDELATLACRGGCRRRRRCCECLERGSEEEEEDQDERLEGQRWGDRQWLHGPDCRHCLGGVILISVVVIVKLRIYYSIFQLLSSLKLETLKPHQADVARTGKVPITRSSDRTKMSESKLERSSKEIFQLQLATTSLSFSPFLQLQSIFSSPLLHHIINPPPCSFN